MEILSVEKLSFTYPEAKEQALNDINFSVKKGEFIVICGPSGSGKSTLLRLMKPEIAPYGKLNGTIYYKNRPIKEHAPIKRAKELGMVFQHPDHQIVMDSVMDELLFGLENIGYTTQEMRKKIAEMTHFFDINHLLDKPTDELSGGEKQLVNLASVLLLDPDVLLLDEPTSQLDPIASKEFIHTIERLNNEFGITIIIVEHRLEELFTVADKVLVLEAGELIYLNDSRHIIHQLSSAGKLEAYLPNTAKVYLNYSEHVQADEIPLNVKETKEWLNKQNIKEEELLEPDGETTNQSFEKEILQLKEIDFQYDSRAPLVLDNLSMSINQGEWRAILGANGSGKSTLLKTINGILKPQHGHLKYNGKKQKRINPGQVGYLPQDPILFFVQDSIMKEYVSIAEAFKIKDAKEKINTLLKRFQFESFKDRHPYDLSGGELQKAALIGTLLVNPSVLLIDEPTKGLDPDSKAQLGSILQSLVEGGMTIIMVTHDVEFTASYATNCSMIFRGQVTVTESTNQFFKENMYYTTVMNRITRKLAIPPVITLEEAKEKWDFQPNI